MMDENTIDKMLVLIRAKYDAHDVAHNIFKLLNAQSVVDAGDQQ
jgi:hypothetical protein